MCHRADGERQGIMNNYLTIRPADLTQSSEEERRHIPVWQTYHAMEGREEIRGHGSRDMRLWVIDLEPKRAVTTAAHALKQRDGCLD